jgi:sodium/bile acid cotransporter 7
MAPNCRERRLCGAGHWRLHLAVLAVTFVLFPLLGLGVSHSGPAGADRQRHAVPHAAALHGAKFDCLYLHRAGQCGGGGVSASFSNILGLFITPLLATC